MVTCYEVVDSIRHTTSKFMTRQDLRQAYVVASHAFKMAQGTFYHNHIGTTEEPTCLGDPKPIPHSYSA